MIVLSSFSKFRCVESANCCKWAQNKKKADKIDLFVAFTQFLIARLHLATIFSFFCFSIVFRRHFCRPADFFGFFRGEVTSMWHTWDSFQTRLLWSKSNGCRWRDLYSDLKALARIFEAETDRGVMIRAKLTWARKWKQRFEVNEK